MISFLLHPSDIKAVSYDSGKERIKLHLNKYASLSIPYTSLKELVEIDKEQLEYMFKDNLCIYWYQIGKSISIQYILDRFNSNSIRYNNESKSI